MFGGIVEALGIIKKIHSTKAGVDFIISKPAFFNDLIIGDSISVNGVCLTVTKFLETDFYVTAVPETLRVSNLSELNESEFVNLERAIKLGSRIGGHYVQGHIDTVGRILDINQDGVAITVKISISSEYLKYIVKKGYICIDGMSITIADILIDSFTVSIIPQTQSTTIVSHYKLNTKLNIEFDVLGKYVEKILGVNKQ
ncbi:riboflavin synthase [Gammaproteobacteria bacterium]|nr:riboflavin synthase [Gammaproteobacteria bacterium]